MGYVQFELPDDLSEAIGRRVAEGKAASEADFVAEAVRLYVDHLDTQAEMAAGRYVTILTQAEAEALHRRTVDRLRTNLAAG